MFIIAASSAIIFYILALYFIHRRLGLYSIYQLITFFALVLHAQAVFLTLVNQGQLLLNLINMVAIVSLIIACLVWISNFFYFIAGLSKSIYFLSIIALLLLLGHLQQHTQAIDINLLSHVILSVTAYAILTLCFITAILLNLQDNKLHHHRLYSFKNKLLPLQTLESILIWGLYIGFVFLSASLWTGFVFLEDIFAQHLVHKTVLSMAAWLVLLILLIFRLIFGLRGRKLIILVQINFMLLIIAYFGSKFVLEYLL